MSIALDLLQQQREARETALHACDMYMQAKTPPPFVAGETYIPVSGKCLDAADLRHLVDACFDLWLTEGRFAAEFAVRLSQQLSLKHCALTVSGSAANLLAFSALTSHRLHEKRIQPGSEVITVACGFPTTVAPIIQNQCIPVFVDVDLGTYNVNVQELENAITPQTRAIMIAHTLGNPFNLEAVTRIAKEHNLYLIEDCCDALGSTYDGKHVGTFGDMATVSFYPAHHITTGEGGAVLTNRLSLQVLLESFRDWGRDCWCKTGCDNTCEKRFGWKLGDLPLGYDHKYIYSHIGYNMKMTDIQAALGIAQLEKLPFFVDKRKENFQYLTSLFRSEKLDEHFLLPQATEKSDPSWFGFPLLIKNNAHINRRKLLTYLEERKIGTRLLFAGNLTRQPAFSTVPYETRSSLKNADHIMNDAFWLGVWPGITAAHCDYMVETILSFIKQGDCA